MGEFCFLCIDELSSLRTSLAIGRKAVRDSSSTFMKLQAIECADTSGIPSLDIGGLDICGGDR